MIVSFELVPSDFWQKPHFVKPNAEGSGMGISKESSLGSEFTSSKETIIELLEKYQDVLVEEYLPGREFTSGFIGSPFLFLPIAEIGSPRSESMDLP